MLLHGTAHRLRTFWARKCPVHEVTPMDIKNLEETLKPHCDSHNVVTFSLHPVFLRGRRVAFILSDHRIPTLYIQPWHPPTNHLLTARALSKAETRSSRVCKKKSRWLDRGGPLPSMEEEAGAKYCKKLAHEFPNWLWIAKGMQSLRVIWLHSISRLHADFGTWPLQKTSLHGLRSTQNYLSLYPYILNTLSR